MITDTLPTGLTFFPGSVVIDGISSTAYTNVGQQMEFNLGAISEKHIITYSTTVEGAAYLSNIDKTYTNTAMLTGTGVPANAISGIGIGVPSSLIKKVGSSYDKLTGEILWTVTVNSNEVLITNPVITDAIMIGQEYVGGSASITGTPPGGFVYTAAVPGDTTKTGTLVYTFGAPITTSYVITFRTKVTDPKVYAGNANMTYSNTASITGDEITSSSATGTQQVVSNVINKKGIAYDYVTRIITWEVEVNNNEMALENVVLTDNIPKGMEYITGSETITSPALSTGFAYTPAVPGDTAKTGTLTYTYAGTINEKYVITFQTRLTDLGIFKTNGDKTIRNTAVLVHDLVLEGISNEGTQLVKNEVVTKEAIYTPGKKYIDWVVNINANEIPLYNAVITDELQEGLALDTTSVKLVHQSIASNGTLILGAEVILSGANVKYNSATRLFTFTLPTPAVGAYQLTFRTDVTNKDKSPFSNQVKFNGTGSDEQAGSVPMAVLWAGSGSSGGGEVGSITVFKVDLEDLTKKLEGAEFILEDKYGNAIQEAISDSNGELKFDQLRYDVPYTVKEIVAPVGYNLSSENYTFTIGSGIADLKDIQYQYKNAKIHGNIRIFKKDSSGKPIKGVEFILYDKDKQIVGTATSDEYGEVIFSNVPYGSYTIEEIKVPTGYMPSTTPMVVNITENDKTYDLGTVTSLRIDGVTEMPKTGDRILLRVITFVLSSGALIGMFVYEQRKKKKQGRLYR